MGDVALIRIDPISSYLGNADSHKNAEVRSVLEPIGEMAERMRVAVLSVTHFSKTGAANTTKALHRFIGSIAFVGAPRAAFAVIEDADDHDRRLFLHAKNNLATPPAGLAFRLRQTIIGGPDKAIVTSCVDWEPEHVNMTANDALEADAGSGDSYSARDEADSFLREVLSGGSLPAKEVKRQAEEVGIAIRTLKRAKHSLGVKARREGGITDAGQWLWSLPKGTSGTFRGPSQRLAPLVPLDHFRHSAGDETPKGANTLSGTLNQPDIDFPELPEFLRRTGA
jgi:hypothetical protein